MNCFVVFTFAELLLRLTAVFCVTVEGTVALLKKVVYTALETLI